MSQGGKPIIAIASRTHNGESKIVSTIRPGAGVVTTRAHVQSFYLFFLMCIRNPSLSSCVLTRLCQVHYVVTEYGVASLFGKNLPQRAKALINIAHPDHREALMADARKRYGSLA